MKIRWRQCLCIAASMALTAPLITGCKTGGTPSHVNMKSLLLKDIAYQTAASPTEESNDIRTTVPASAKTGETVKATTRVNTTLENYNYFIVDWGDGTWSYNGPYAQNVSGSLTHVYKKAGTYAVRSLCKNLKSGDGVGWSKPAAITVTGDPYASQYITEVRAISSGDADSAHKAENILDNDGKTSWISTPAKDILGQVWVGMELSETRRLDSLEIQVPSESAIWPANFAVEYTTDRGKTWQSLPKYYYEYAYSKGRYTPIMNFPNPKGATLVLPLDSISANGIRIISMMFPLDQTSAKKTMEISEMRVTGDNRALFYTSKGGTFDADLNNMWLIYGSAATEPTVTGNKAGPNPDPFRTGCATITSTEWLEWDGLKHLWTTDFDGVKSLYDNALFNVKVGPDGHGNDGYVWATIDSQKHLGLANHYTYNQIFIIAARNYLFTGNDTDGFFDRKNNSGDTMASRLDKAMQYMLTVEKGSSGVLTITDPDNNDTPQGNSSNYWDAIKAFGYISSYENIYFYRSLLAMADIETFRGDTAKAKEYADLAAKTKTAFNKTFWDASKGRYITSIDANGKKLDFGITFVNTMAVSAGLADASQAKLIYDWLDGKRIIAGDTSQGKDIYSAFKIASRSITVDISTVGPPYYWEDYNGQLPCTPGTFGGWGNQMQNGGTIFYISYYDLLGRLDSLGSINAFSFFKTILNEFHVDSLRRFPYTVHGGYVEGVIGEFPESGLVPLTFLDGFMGISVAEDGLHISPKLPGELSYAGVRSYEFSGRTYSIKVSKQVGKPSAKQVGNVWFVELPADKGWVITKDNKLAEQK